MAQAIAIDLGATSGRFAHGRFEDGLITFEVVEQIPNVPIPRFGHLVWDIDALLALCRRAADYAGSVGATTIGIDGWGVDHGFLNANGELIMPPICYRDRSHDAVLAELAPFQQRLYELTGIQKQPFNTICQLIARRNEDPTLPRRAADWMVLPDLLGYLLTGERHHELTEASTTQLLGLDGQWAAEAFEIAGWPMPERAPSPSGTLGREVVPGVRLAHVGSHDTASAVAGFGALGDDQIFLNVGTWSLIGCVVEEPLASAQAASMNFTNERTVDGRVRLLKNVPGFYVVNRIHEELGVQASVPEWLAAGEPGAGAVDLLDEEFFNPESMVETCVRLAGYRPESEAEWAGFAIRNLTETLARLPGELTALTGREFRSIRVGGGGSQSEVFCRSLAESSGLPVLAGPAEATVLGNLAVQFLASGDIGTMGEMYQVISDSVDVRRF
jgi:rhamnulokinase